MILLTGNPHADRAYRHALWGLIPLAALYFGPSALVRGLLGLRYARATAKHPGLGAAWASIVLGSLETISHVAGLACIGVFVVQSLG